MLLTKIIRHTSLLPREYPVKVKVKVKVRVNVKVKVLYFLNVGLMIISISQINRKMSNSINMGIV